MKLYSPSNSDEGIWFESQWCEKCIKNPITPEAQGQCNVLMRELCADKQTGRWIYKGHIPTCTAFKSRIEANKNRKKTYKSKIDKNQLELF